MRYLNPILILLPTLLFLLIGLRWLIEPATVAPEFGFDLGQGLGRSSQVADIASFFLTGSLCGVAALITQNRTWLVPTMMLCMIATLGRTLAWLVHDASFATAQIAIELVITSMLLIAYRRMK